MKVDELRAANRRSSTRRSLVPRPHRARHRRRAMRSDARSRPIWPSGSGSRAARRGHRSVTTSLRMQQPQGGRGRDRRMAPRPRGARERQILRISIRRRHSRQCRTIAARNRRLPRQSPGQSTLATDPTRVSGFDTSAVPR